jgi:hypothetical protein
MGRFSVMSHGCLEQSSILRQCEDSFYRLMIAVYLSVSGVTMLPNSNSTILFAKGPVIQENKKLC